jgi:sterol desaturase/sphingolipid hydroxylase (fatty acid hydroxylase superfamily)
MAAMNRLFQRWVLSRAWLTFVVMCSSFGLFGAGTLNIFSMFSTNWDMITQQGLMALASGTLSQLLELLGTLALAMFFYTIFKACEHSLVHRILHPSDKDPHS